jgi:glycosyltransferase involved in cell wall biosynthesis
MRIVLVGTELASVREGAGGLEHLLLGWARSLSERHGVLVVSPGDTAASPPWREPGEPFTRGSLPDPDGLSGVAAAWHADVVVVNNRPQWITDVPTVVIFHNDIDAWQSPQLGPRPSRELVASARSAGGLGAVSRYLAGRVQQHLGAEPVVQRVTPFVDPEFVVTGAPRKPVVLYAGRLLRKKGIELLVEVADRMPEVSFWITDFLSPWNEPTEEHTHLRRMVRARPNCELVPPPTNRTDMAALMGGVGTVLVPSVWPEPFGLVSIEAQAVGTRVVVTSVGGLPETVVGSTSAVVASRDPEGMVIAVREALSQGPLDAPTARDVRHRFSIEASTASVERLVVRAVRA